MCPIICVSRARRVEHIKDEVLVVSLDRLMPALRRTRPLRRAIMVDATITRARDG